VGWSRQVSATARAGLERGPKRPAIVTARALAPGEVGRQIECGTPAFRRTSLAMFSAGFSTFALLYCVQPLLPVFSREFHVGAAESSLSLSLTSGFLAVAVLVAGSLSDAWGRKPVMVVSLLASAALTVVAAMAPGWHGLLVVRALEGIALGGLPAVAMAYLGEEMHVRSIAPAKGQRLPSLARQACVASEGPATSFAGASGLCAILPCQGNNVLVGRGKRFCALIVDHHCPRAKRGCLTVETDPSP